MNLNIDLGFRGLFVVSVIDAKTKRVKRMAEPQKNLLTDLGMNYLGTGTSGWGGAAPSAGWFAYCHAGTDNTAPNVADTTLGAQVGSPTTAGYSSTYVSGECGTSYDDSSKTFVMWRTYDFASPAVSTTYREVGVGYSSSLCCNRALINGGTGVSVDTDEQLRVYFQLEITVNGPFTSTPRSSLITQPGPTYIDGDFTMAWFPVGSWPFTAVQSSGSAESSYQHAFLEPSENISISRYLYFWVSDSDKVLPGATMWNQTYNSTDHNFGENVDTSPATVNYGSCSVGSYSSGSFTRTKTATFSPTLGTFSNMKIIGVGNEGSGGQDSYAWTFRPFVVAVLDSAFTKSATQRLTVNLVYTWARL